MNNDSHLIFEAYKNRPVNENMPYPVFAKLSKHASPGSAKEALTVDELAAKHGVDAKVIQHQMQMGIKVETEHTDDLNIATKIATDHLNEDPHYYTKLAKMEAENEEGDLMKHMKDKGMIDAKATEDTGKYGRTREEEERRIDPKCWKGYHKVGTKMKGDVRVNNCKKNS
jgi:Protein of unknown function (DUF5661)